MAGMDLSQLKAFVDNIVLTNQTVYNDAIFRVGTSDNVNFDEVCLLIKKKIERQAAGIGEDGKLISGSDLDKNVKENMQGFINMVSTSIATNVAADIIEKMVYGGEDFTTSKDMFIGGGGLQMTDIKESNSYGALLEVGIMGGKGAFEKKQHSSTAGADKDGKEFKTNILKKVDGIYKAGKIDVSTAQVYYKGYGKRGKGSVSTTNTEDPTLRLIFLLWQLIKKMDNLLYMNVEEKSFEAGAYRQVPTPGKFNSKGEPKTHAEREFPQFAMTATLSIRALTLYTEIYVKALLDAIQETMRIKITNNGIEEDNNGVIIKWGVVITFADLELTAVVNSLSQLYLDSVGYIANGHFNGDDALRDSIFGAMAYIQFGVLPRGVQP